MLKIIFAILITLFTASICYGQTAAGWFTRAEAKSSLGDYAGAIADYDKAIELDPEYAAAFSNRGDAKSNLGDYAGAIADFDKAIELDPKDATAYRHRGLAKIRWGQKDSGCLDFSKAVELGFDANDLIEKYCK